MLMASSSQVKESIYQLDFFEKNWRWNPLKIKITQFPNGFRRDFLVVTPSELEHQLDHY